MFKEEPISQSLVDSILSRRWEQAFPSKEEVVRRLAENKRLRVYLGIDPTGPDLHLGHTIPLLFLKDLSRLGHQPVLLIGDFTARIGDPTNKEATRRPLSEKQVKENMKNYLDQISKIVPIKSLEVHYNSSWLKKMNLGKILELASQITVQQLLAREMFQERLGKEKSIGLHEFLYPLMQGYDSVAMKVDGEVGGSDQMFNMLVGRRLMEIFCQKDKMVFTTRLLTDASRGQKMSKTEGGFVSLNQTADDIFGQVMAAISDQMIKTVFELCTEKDLDWIREQARAVANGANPRDFKLKLAWELVKMYQGEKTANQAQEKFLRVFSHRQPQEEDWSVVKVPAGLKNIVDILVGTGLAHSRGEIKRLIKKGAVKLNGQPVTNWEINLELTLEGAKIALGPRRLYRLVPE